MSEKRDLRNIVHALIWDVGAPVIVYYPLRLLGVSMVMALAAAAVVAIGRIAFVAVRERRFDGFAALMAAMFGLGLVLTLATGDPRVVLAKDSVVTGVIGLTFLGSCVAGKPLMFALVRKVLPPERHAEAETRMRTDPRYRHRLVTLSLVWGGILLAEALLRIVLVYTLPVDVMVGLSHVLQWVALGLAVLWSAAYGRRARRREAAVAAAR